MSKLADELTKRLIARLTSEPEKLPQSPEAVTWDTHGVGSMDIQEFADALKAALTEAMQAVRKRDAEMVRADNWFLIEDCAAAIEREPLP